jgi:hypothetical protein
MAIHAHRDEVEQRGKGRQIGGDAVENREQSAHGDLLVR